MATDTVALPAVPRANGKHLPAEQRELMLRLITENPAWTDGQIAKLVGVTRAAVWKVRKANKAVTEPESTEPLSMTERVERLIGKHLPPERWVPRMAEMIDDPKTPPSVVAQLVKMGAEYGGTVTKKEQRDAEVGALPGNVFSIVAAILPSAAPVSTPQVVVEAVVKKSEPASD